MLTEPMTTGSEDSSLYFNCAMSNTVHVTGAVMGVDTHNQKRLACSRD